MISDINLFLLPGFSSICYLDTENVEKGKIYSKINTFKDAFPHIQFEKVEGNTFSYRQVSSLLSTKYFEVRKSQLLRQISVKNYKFGYEYIFIDYRLPILRENLKTLRSLISDSEGVLLYPEKKLVELDTM